MGYMDLGEPAFDDVDAAAHLLVRYERAGKRGREFYEMFAMSVYDWDSVNRRADELRASGSSSA